MAVAGPLGAIGGLAIALLTVHLLQRRFGAPPPARRFATLDGLRGYAAFLVYLHHATIWYFFARTGEWTLPPSRLSVHFGQSSVAVFFMITGLLFWTKLIEGRSAPVDWRRLFVSRLLRLTPLFAFALLLIVAAGLAVSGPHLRVSAPRLALQLLQWMTFTIAGMPDINRTPSAVMGGPAWSLPYEWWFYLSLPLASLLYRRPAPVWMALGAAGAIGGAWWISAHAGWIIAAGFLGGIGSALLVRRPAICAAARHWSASLLCIAVLAAVTRFTTAFAPAPLLLLSLAFALVACGNTIFGALEWEAARGLGEIGYSVYLLHGIVLFLVCGMAIGVEGMAALTPTQHWLVTLACAPLVVALSFATFRLIEAPAMGSVDRVNGWLSRAG